MSAKRSWAGRAAAAAMAVGLALATSAVIAAPAAEQVDSVIVPSAKSLLKFYPMPLSSSPFGVVEDSDVWLAKVQGLVASAPSWLQQNVLSSSTRQEFSANLGLLQQIQKGSLEDGSTAVKSLAKSGSMTPKLGFSGPADLLYTAVEPCRIMDTRFATAGSGVQGPIAGNSLKQIPGFIGTNWGIYGGNGSSDCGLSSSVGSNIWGVAIVISILAEGGRPNFDAYLGVGDNSTLAGTLSTSALNFTHGQGISTLYIVPQISGNTIFFAMPASLSANIVFDVVGYFAVSQATALQCTNTAESNLVLASNSNGTLAAPACPAGYTKVSSSCRSTFFNSLNYATVGFAANGNDCQATAGGGGATLNASATCCRVPGR